MKKVCTLILVSVFAVCSCSEEVLFDFDENLARELQEIDSFIAAHNIPVDVHESETRFRVLNEGVGDAIERRDTVFFNYQIYLLDSTLIDSNLEEVLVANNLTGANNMPIRDVFFAISDFSRTGFLNVAFELGTKQSKFHMFVPSHMAYGAGGRTFNQNRIIPSYTPLLVEVEIVDVRPGG